MSKEQKFSGPVLATEAINNLMQPILGTKFSFIDLEQVVKKITGTTEIDYNQVVQSFRSMAEMASKLSLSNVDFIGIFGNDLYELLVESQVSIREVMGERRFAAIQLHHRTDGQLLEAHRILCSRGARLDHVLSSGRDLSMSGARHHTILLSVELPQK